MKRAKEAALSIVRRFGHREPCTLAEDMGIVYVEFPFAARVRGLTTVRRGVRVIAINKSMPVEWKRTIAAHELGHAVLHGMLGYYFVVDKTLFPAGRLEREANEFAAELLIPDEDLEQWRHSSETHARAAEAFMVPIELLAFKLNALN